jgi:ABC-type Fe3+ transport system permease subunit
MPQLKLAIWGGTLLVSLHLLAEYGLYAMLRFDTFTTAIFDQFQSSFNGPAANMLAGVLACAVWHCCGWRREHAATPAMQDWVPVRPAAAHQYDWDGAGLCPRCCYAC